jgi:hypothetical protein
MNPYKLKQAYKIFVLILLLVYVSAQRHTVVAQEIDNPWSAPYNLSKSGSTTNPSLVEDSTGVVHVVWLDEFAGFIYSRFASNEWSNPLAINFPFSKGITLATTPITMISDKDGFIHAFWIGEGNILYYGSVAGDNFGSSWGKPHEVDRFVSGFDVIVNDRGDLHIAYVKSQDRVGTPAGIYYQNKKAGLSWSTKVPIYLSPYFRPESNETRYHVDISATSIADAPRVFIGWDNPARNQVSIRRSDDGGDTWSEPYDVVHDSETASSGKPYSILMAPQGNNALMIWQTGVPEESCTTSYVWSTDSGTSWSEPQSLLGNLPGCPSENQLFESSDGTVILMTTILDQVYLLAWNGVQWSEPQVQDALNSFKDPISKSLVTMDCRRSILGDKDRLYYIGCDPKGTGDIWILDRLIGPVADLFPPEPVWSKPEVLASNPLGIFEPLSISDSSGQIHVFWTQEDRTESGDRVIPIYYTSTTGDGWLTPFKILNSPDNEAENLQVAIDERDRLYLVWDGNRSGEIYFSWASADVASSPTEWEAPITLPSVKPLNSSPTIVASSSGNLYVAYALTLNENRGIYLVNSSDGGRNWGSPRLVVDAVTAGMNMVDRPILAQTNSGRLHLIFTENALLGDRNPIALFYVASDDNGVTWSRTTPVTDHPLNWFNLISPDGVQVHNLWQDIVENLASIWQGISTNDGETWSQPVNIASISSVGGQVDVLSDEADRLYLVQIVDDPGKGQVLKHWIWDGESWSTQEDLRVTNSTSVNIKSIEALTTKAGQLIAFFVTEQNSVGEDQMPFQLLFSERTISLPLVLPTAKAVPTLTLIPTATSTPESLATEELIPTASPTPVGGQIGGESRPSNISTIGLIAIGLLLLALIGGLIFEIRRRRT